MVLCSRTTAYQTWYCHGSPAAYCREIIIIGKQKARNKDINWLGHSNQNSTIPNHVFRLSNAGHGSPNSRLRKRDSGDSSKSTIGHDHTPVFYRTCITTTNIKFYEYNRSDSTAQVRIPEVPGHPLPDSQRPHPIPNQSQIPHIRAPPTKNPNLAVWSPKGIYSITTPELALYRWYDTFITCGERWANGCWSLQTPVLIRTPIHLQGLLV